MAVQDVYQAQLKADIYQSWQAGNRNVLAVLPTGGGKSVVTRQLSSEIVNYGMPWMMANPLGGCLIAHRQELVSQLSMHVAIQGVQHQIIGPKNVVAAIMQEHRRELGRSFVNPSSRFSVAGVDTILARQADLGNWGKQIGFWGTDEAHHLLRSNKWGKAVELFPNAWGLGVTATPERADGKGLGRHADGVFDDMVEGPTMRELIDMGALTEYQIVVPESDFKTDDLKITDGGDFSPKQLREASDKSHIVGDVVQCYQRFAFGKRGIVFAIDVKDADDIAAAFNAAGIPAASVNAKTKDDVRTEYIRRFRAGDLMILVNVDLFGEGFDVPAVEVVMMARPTMSLAVFLQQFGRALRILPGKQFGLIIDHVSNVKRHGFPDKRRFWSLDARDKRKKRVSDPDEIPLKICGNKELPCLKPYEAFHRACPHCGWMPVPIGGGRFVEQVDGDLMLLDAETLKRMRAAIELESPGHLAKRIQMGSGVANFGGKQAEAQALKIQAQTMLKDAMAVWAGIQRAKGRTDQAELERRFYHAAGLDVLSALAADRSRQDYEKLTAEIYGWIAK